LDQLSLAESATASELAHGKTGKTSQRSPKGHRGPITLDRAIGGKNNGYSRTNSSRLHFRFRISLRIRRSRDCIDGSTVPRSTIAVAHARWIPAKPIRYVYPALIDSTDAQHGMHLWPVSYEASSSLCYTCLYHLGIGAIRSSIVDNIPAGDTLIPPNLISPRPTGRWERSKSALAAKPPYSRSTR